MNGTVPLRRLASFAYGEALPTEVRTDGTFRVASSGGFTGTHDRFNTGAPCIVVGRKVSHGSVHWSDDPVFTIDTAYFIDATHATVDLRYLYYVLKSLDLPSTSADVGVPGLSRESAYAILAPIPPNLRDQRRIADFLDDQVARIDNIIAARAHQTRLFIESSRAKLDRSLDEDAARFGWVPLRRWSTGIEQGWSPQCEATQAEPSEPGILKLSAVKDGRFNESENKALPQNLQPIRAYVVHDGDLLISRANTPVLVGDAAVVENCPPSRYLPDLLYRVRLSIAESEYVSVALRSTRSRALLRVLARGTSQSMVKLRGEDLMEIPMPNAPVEIRQRRTREVLETRASVDQGQTAALRSIESLTELKRSLITAAVTGEFDVSTADGSQVLAGASS